MKSNVATALLMGGALLAAGAAAYLSDTYVRKSVEAHRAELNAQYTPVSVVVASTDLRPGALLSSQTAALREAPKAFLHSDAVTADEWNSVAGRVLVRPIRSGEPLLMSHLAQHAGAGFSSHLPPGERALTLPVDEESSISGMLAPGDRIDILFTASSRNEPVTAPLLLDVAVIATGMRTWMNDVLLQDKDRSSHYRTVTLSVTPQDAARITLAQEAGKLTFVLRRSQDRTPTRLAQVTRSTLLTGARATPRLAARSRVEIILGGT
ncbi:MAG TPA: Flp pilus assembly protein CpaB [Steroidobacter sp.]|nr:Flp pilus assembly protein CpaB [Steroidobacter sp.]